MLYKTGDFLGLPMAEDDNLSNLSGEDQRQDEFLGSLMYAATKPNPELMKEYRLPIKPIGFVVEEDHEDVEAVSSEESEHPGDGSDEEN